MVHPPWDLRETYFVLVGLSRDLDLLPVAAEGADRCASLRRMSQNSALDVVSVGELAAQVGVSPQTLRTWEAQGLITSERTAGGQRRYSTSQVQRATQIAALRRQHGWNPAAIRTALGEAPGATQPDSDRENRMLRAARNRRGLSLRRAAAAIGVSPALLSSVERGQATVSTELFSRIADAYEMPMAALVAYGPSEQLVIRRDDRPTGRGNVTWEELAFPGHGLAPSLVTVPGGEGSGGEYSRVGDTFAFVLKGLMSFTVAGQHLEVREEDSLLVPAQTRFSWSNESEDEARVIWVETIPPGSWSDAHVQQLASRAKSPNG